MGAWPDPDRVNFYLNGQPRYQEVDSALLLDLLARYGYEVPEAATAQQQKRVITAFQMHFRPQLWNGVADRETLAIAEALLEKYGQGWSCGIPPREYFSRNLSKINLKYKLNSFLVNWLKIIRI